MTSLIIFLLLSYISPEHDRISFLDFTVNMSAIGLSNRVKITCPDTSLYLCFHTLAKILSLKVVTNTLSQNSAFTLMKIQINTSINIHLLHMLYREGSVLDVAECRNEGKTRSLSS